MSHVYQGSSHGYTGSAHVYSGVSTTSGELIENWAGGQDRLDSYRYYSNRGQIREAAAYPGSGSDYGHRSQDGRTTEVWSIPSDNLLNTYPGAGSTWVDYFRMDSTTPETQFWFLFGGNSTTRYPRYQVEIIQDGTFRVQVRESSGRWTAAVDNNTTIDWSLYFDDWLPVVKRVFHPDDDGRSGVAAWIFEEGTLPDAFDPDDDTTWGSGVIEHIDSADYTYRDEDGSSVPGLQDRAFRYGCRGSSLSQGDFGMAEIIA